MSRVSGLIADLIAIALFALFARLAHQTDGLALTFEGWASTFWPFAIGVLLAWILVVTRLWDDTRLYPAGVWTWLITVVVGLVIWGIRNQAFPHWSFIIVASVASAVFMLGWRLITRFVIRRRRAA